MNPWGECETTDLVDSQYHTLSNFEDNFNPTVSDCLPDSEKYLAVLEKRLHRIKSDPNVLKQLAEKREACMQEFLNDDIVHNFQYTYLSADNPITAPIIRTLVPHRQVIDQIEVLELVKHDQLEPNREETCESDPRVDKENQE